MPVISDRFDNLGSDGAPVKLGIMGGTFDPIHNGHLNMAAEVAEKLALDALLFIPTGIPVFKRDQEVSPAEDRLEMCRLAIECNPSLDVSAIEVEREGDTYTIDTLRQMREHYPENVQFYFITGSDAAVTVGKWRGSHEIAKLATLVVVTRPGVEVGEQQLAAIHEAGFLDVKCVETTLLDISSSNIRERMKAGKEVRYFLPPSIWKYIRAHGLYGTSANGSLAEGLPSQSEFRTTANSPVDCSHKAGLFERLRVAPRQDAQGQFVRAIPEGNPAPLPVEGGDPLSDEFFQARLADLESRVSARRLKHIEGVAQTCVQLARRYGVDERMAHLAGLLHDWDKGYDDEGIRQRVIDLGMQEVLDPWVVENMPQVLHGQTAACALGRAWPSIPAEVLQAIDRHTTADVEMTDLDKILYIADALEPSRQFGRIDELRALVETATLDELYFATYEYWVFLLFERRKPLHPDTIRIWNDYAVKRAASKG